MTPVREEYIGRPSRGVGHKAKGLLRRCQGRRLGSTEDHIPNDVVTRDPIAVVATADLMVSVDVHSATAFWTGVVIIMKRNP